MKRFFDLTISIFFFVGALPLFVILSVAVIFCIGRPVFFMQARPGRFAKMFKLIKFRTMLDDKDTCGHLLPDSARLTNFGKWLRTTSLDELPELWNVIKGDMSLVGPRPLLPEYIPLYSAEQSRRHEVRPGITGWAQVNGRNAITWEEKFKLDVWYVSNQSFWLDLKILAMTFLHLIRRDGINAQGHTTMPKFTGARDRGSYE